MRYIVGYYDDDLIGTAEDTPPLAAGAIVALNGINHKVMKVDSQKSIPEIHVSNKKKDVDPRAAPDYSLAINIKM